MMQLHQVGASPVFRTWHQTGWLRGWQGPAATRPQTQSCPQGATNCVPLGFTENPQKNWRGKTEADLILKPPWGGERRKNKAEEQGERAHWGVRCRKEKPQTPTIVQPRGPPILTLPLLHTRHRLLGSRGLLSVCSCTHVHTHMLAKRSETTPSGLDVSKGLT